ncbi:MAG: insulinase family protein, partial [Elusimicrobia bacterium]|nr:insulinase family protein [Elusimicrobiota bacterium]
PTIYDKDLEAMQVAVNVLSSPLGGRMFQRIRDELGKAYTLGGSVLPFADAGMVVFYTLTTAENVGKVRSIIEEELASLGQGPVTPEELAAAQAYLVGNWARDRQTIGARAGQAAADEFLGLGHDHDLSFPERVRSVSAEDVQAVARDYLEAGRAAIITILPSEKGSGEGVNKTQ